MDLRKIKALIELLEKSSLTELEIKEGEETVRLARHNHVVRGSGHGATCRTGRSAPPSRSGSGSSRACQRIGRQGR